MGRGLIAHTWFHALAGCSPLGSPSPLHPLTSLFWGVLGILMNSPLDCPSLSLESPFFLSLPLSLSLTPTGRCPSSPPPSLLPHPLAAPVRLRALGGRAAAGLVPPVPAEGSWEALRMPLPAAQAGGRLTHVDWCLLHVQVDF